MRDRRLDPGGERARTSLQPDVETVVRADSLEHRPRGCERDRRAVSCRRGRRDSRPRGASARVEPPKAARPNPPPRIFPSTVTSGISPSSSCAPPAASRNPVITSSKITRPPAPRTVRPRRRGSRARAARARRSRPPARGSRLRAVSRPPRRPPRAHPRSLHGSTHTASRLERGTPAEPGAPGCAALAADQPVQRWSAQPW